MTQIIHGDCLQVLPTLPANSVDLVIADPPYNIGFDYGPGEYHDKLPREAYLNFTKDWLRCIHRVLKPNGTLWVVIGDEYAAELKIETEARGFSMRSWVVWYYTFGVNSPGKFTRSHAHLLYFTKDKAAFTFNADQVRVPSARATVYNDKRANPDGRLPDDTWILRPQELPGGGIPADHDVWDVSRVCGTFKQRQADAANQLPEQLVGRIIRACSNPGDVVLDPMCSTGTVPAVAKKLGRQYIGIELSETFQRAAVARCNSVNPGDMLDGVERST